MKVKPHIPETRYNNILSRGKKARRERLEDKVFVGTVDAKIRKSSMNIVDLNLQFAHKLFLYTNNGINIVFRIESPASES